MRHLTISATVLLFAGLVSVVDLGAQANDPNGPTPPAVAVGSPPPSYGFGVVDNVDYFTGNLDINIPLLNLTGRGDVPLALNLPITGTWTVSPTTLAPVYPSIFQGQAVYAPAGSLSAVYGYSGSGACAPALTWVVWTSQSGTETNLADEKYGGQPQTGGNSTCSPQDVGRVFHSYDGSSLTYVSNSDVYDFYTESYGTLYFPSGTRYVFNASETNTETILDRNGNEINVQLNVQGPVGCDGSSDKGVYTITDSVGRTITITYAQSQDCADSDAIQFPGSMQSGVPRTVTVNHNFLSNNLLISGQSTQSLYCLFPLLTGSKSTIL